MLKKNIINQAVGGEIFSRKNAILKIIFLKGVVDFLMDLNSFIEG